MDEDRVRHSLAVAKKMIELNDKNLDEKDLFLIGYLHDIGYEFTMDKSKHNEIWGKILKNCNFKYWQEVFYQRDPNSKYISDYLTILNKSDMMIDNKGNDIGYDKRLENIKGRYGIESKQYIEAKELINILKL